MLSTSNSNVTDVRAQETCKQFIGLIRGNYKQLKGVRFGKSGRTFIFHAGFRRRQLFAWGNDSEYAMSRFMLEIHRKVFREEYYSREAFRAIRAKLRERVIMKYAIRELPPA
jgi:hypothetical protein